MGKEVTTMSGDETYMKSLLHIRCSEFWGFVLQKFFPFNNLLKLMRTQELSCRILLQKGPKYTKCKVARECETDHSPLFIAEIKKCVRSYLHSLLCIHCVGFN